MDYFSEESIQADEDEFERMLTKRAANDGGKIKVVDVAKKESELEVKEVVTLANVIKAVTEKFPGLKHERIPICNSAAPLEKDFDALCAALLGTNVNCPVIVNCQVKNFLPDRLCLMSSERSDFSLWQQSETTSSESLGA